MLLWLLTCVCYYYSNVTNELHIISGYKKTKAEEVIELELIATTTMSKYFMTVNRPCTAQKSIFKVTNEINFSYETQ